MNALTLKPSTKPLFTRFAWKEYRMLRGFWLAGFGMGFILQFCFEILTQRTRASDLFNIAWGAAALYVVGAAITTFCAETEDRTREYLRLLPGDWRPIFAAKILISLASALLLGCALSISGWSFAGHWPEPQDMQLTLSLFGVAILEGLAWGLLFSMWWKQPLLAAVAAIACASLSTQLAILGTTSANDAFSLEAYRDAVPGRLLVCAAVLFLDVMLGSQWLYPRKKEPLWSENQSKAINLPASNTHAVTAKKPRPRLKMFSRLLWQTWRESWKPLLIAVPLSFGLMAAFMIPAYIRSTYKFLESLPFVALIPPALLGALAFRADQQRDHRLFLATHAASPLLVWLARHFIWFSIVLVLGVTLQVIGSWMMQSKLADEIAYYLRRDWTYYTDWLGREFSTDDPPWMQAWRFESMRLTYVRGVLTTWFAFVAAYGMGQLCSMLLKQTLLSGFLAILLALVIASWSVLMFFWQMNPLWFVLPIGLAALVATWLRTPNWILGKSHFRHWVSPILAFSFAILLMMTLVPSTRMAQLSVITQGKSLFDRPFEDWDKRFTKIRSRASDTALSYERLANEIDERDHESLKYSAHAPTSLMSESLEELAQRVAEVTQRPYCLFPKEHVLTGSLAGAYLRKLQILLREDALRLQRSGELGQAFERFCAQLRFDAHKMQFQGTGLFAEVLRQEIRGADVQPFQDILDWAEQPEQTSDQLKLAITELSDVYSDLPEPAGAIHADREAVRKVILEEQPPTHISHQRWAVLNRLPGEQRRALEALDILCVLMQKYVYEAQKCVTATTYSENKSSAQELCELLRAAPSADLYAINESMSRGNFADFRLVNQLIDACATSFLVTSELRSIVNLQNLLKQWVAAETSRRALLVQIALMAYRIDHGEYPQTLAELAPTYIPREIYDPFSGKSFVYHPEGLDLPLVIKNYQGGADSREISAGTPLFWSVGLFNSRLEEVADFFGDDVELGGSTYSDDSLNNDIDDRGAELSPSEPRPNDWREVYVLEDGNFAIDKLIFPLPKVESPEEPAPSAGSGHRGAAVVDDPGPVGDGP